MTREMQPAALQPLGFWTARAGQAIRARTRGRLAELDVTQPEWWLLHQLSLHLAGAHDVDVVATIGPNESDGAITEAIASSIDKGWVVRDDDRILLTATGTERFHSAATVQRELNDERRHGISDDDYVTTIEVLQRTIANVGGDAWHW
ncbi:MarR family winged helix-turn-helix transcriptional regulator [Williamsia sterculiae]|uniref:DNA-binding transcriptional regulator, MarR family n=1 Tax=Williamsia sterculiae TaxID=1344003 RepID=A0A1N7FWC0_9NOCA|nr:hypothetical protein [Williamsia sterculiae]SIS04604.1 hypothetical protein SAMN05445060_2345 [Williamsia sterculiae]